jgi:hypothetical protein
MLVIKNFNKIKETAKSILPPDLQMYVYFKNEFNYEMSFIYNKDYAKDIYVMLERERHPIYFGNRYKLIVKGDIHTLWNNGIPTKTNIMPLVVERLINDTTLKNATHFLEGITEIILSNFNDPGFNM